MPAGTGLLRFAKEFPDRFFDVGIAEEHAVTMSAGMAKQGLVPVCAVYSTFLQRAYDQVIHDVAIEGLHVVLAVDRAGVVGEDGETHQGVFDCSYLCSVPNMTVLCPANEQELASALSRAVNEMGGPVAIRYPRGPQGKFLNDMSGVPTSVVREGTHATVVTCGILINNALEAARQLESEGISAEVIKLFSVKPLDIGPVAQSLAKTGRLVVAEDGVPEGGVGVRLLAALAAQGCAPRAVRLLNTGDRFLPNGCVPQLHELCGLDAAGIARAVREAVRDV
jgi:1-deoxy-D-xylulose-5-phosphate synthase